MSIEPTKTTTPRRTRGKALLPAPAVPSIAEAHELANNPKALELAQKLAKVEGELAAKQAQYNAQGTLYSNVRTECESLKRELAEAQSKLGRIDNAAKPFIDRTRQKFGVMPENCNIYQAAEKWEKAFQGEFDRVEREIQEGESLRRQLRDQTARLEAKQLEVRELLDNRQAVEVTIAELKGQRDALQQLLTNAEDSAKAWEQTASERQSRIEALEIQVASWKERRAEADLRAEALQVERDQWKATAQRYQDSTNHLGGLVKEQARGEEYHGPEADLPGGLMEGVNWGAVVVWIGAALAIVAFWAGLVIGGAK